MIRGSGKTCLRGLVLGLTFAVATIASVAGSPAVAATSPAARVELTLADAVALAMRQNPEVVSASQALDLERSKFRESSSSRLPKIVVQESLRAGSVTSAAGAQTSGTASAPGVALTQVLPAVLPEPFKVGLSPVEQAELSVESTELDLAKTRQKVEFDVVSAYLNVLKAQQMGVLSDGAAARAEGFLDEVKSKLALGVATQLDLVKAQNQLDETRFSELKAEDDLAGAMRALALLLGLPAETGFNLVNDFQVQGETRSLEELTALAIANRAEVRQANLAVTSLRAALDSANRSRWPSVSLSAEYSSQESLWVAAQASLSLTSGDASWKLTAQSEEAAQAGSMSGNPGETSSSVGIDVSWTLWDGGVAAEKIRQAQTSLDIQESALARQKQTIAEDVYAALIGLKQSLLRIELAQKAADEAEEGLRVTEARFTAGAGVASEVIDAGQTLASAKAEAIGALFDCYLAKARLEKATGALGAGNRSDRG